MLVSMKEILDRANKENYCVAAPNITSELDARAAIEAAEEMNAPIILDFGYGWNADIYTLGTIVNIMAQKTFVPVALNLDHGGKFEHAIAAVKAGFTSIMVDRSSLPYEVNVNETKEQVKIAHAVGISVEAELGHVGMADNYNEDGKSNLTSPEEAKKFIEETGVDCLAVAIGTAHGAYAKGQKPYIDYERLVEIKKATGAPLVLHGGSGTGDEALRKASQLGINKINISNDLCRAAYNEVVNTDMSGNNVYNLYNLLQRGYRNRLKELIEVFGSKDKAWQKNHSLYSDQLEAVKEKSL